MKKERKHIVPWVKKKSVTIVSVGDAGNEWEAVRSVLEWFNYRVDTLLIGSRKEFMEMLKGTIKTSEYIILSVHGDEGITMVGEDLVVPDDITKHAKLNGKIVINLGCNTGSKTFINAFKKATVKAYVAPVGHPGSGAALFAIHLFYYLQPQLKQSLRTAVRKARAFDEEGTMFKLFEKK